MHNTLKLLENSDFPLIFRDQLETLQINIGLKCNQQCVHCHVNASPKRTEAMSRETIDLVLEFIKNTPDLMALDITGGAPELHPDFRYLVSAAGKLDVRIIDRCNLTILLEPGQEDLAEFLATNRVDIIASLPCYLEENVDRQRGKGVYEKSIRALRLLNEYGYGKREEQGRLDLIYNPQGPVLPPEQSGLEDEYKKRLMDEHGIEFNQLFVLCNMPINRFGSTLVSQNQFHQYMALLKQAYRKDNLQNVMCRTLISVDWQGYVYDCDFNQMLGLDMKSNGNQRTHLSELVNAKLKKLPITVRDHCYGCTAGQGSSCGGAL